MTDAPVPPPAKPFDEKSYALFLHLAGFSGHLVPFGNILVPYLLWQNKRAESAFIDAQGREAVSFQATMLLLILLCIPLVFILIGIPLILLLAAIHAIFTVIAAIKSSNGESYRYPFSIPFAGRA